MEMLELYLENRSIDIEAEETQETCIYNGTLLLGGGTGAFKPQMCRMSRKYQMLYPLMHGLALSHSAVQCTLHEE
jgi:hypothetical protein